MIRRIYSDSILATFADYDPLPIINLALICMTDKERFSLAKFYI